MKNASAQAAPPPFAACLAGFAICVAGLWLGSPWFLRFVARRLSGDGVLDVYTCEKAGELAWKLLAAGFLVPLIALAAPAFFSWSPRPRMARFVTLIWLASLMAGFLWLAAVPPYQAAAPRSQADEIQYAIPAVNALVRGRLVMVINEREYPPYTPIGFQLLLIPFYRVFGTMVGNGIRAVQASALLSLAGIYALGAATLGKRRGLLASLLLATNPGFIYWTEGIMTTTTNFVLTVAALLLLLSFWRAMGGRRVVLAALLGAILGVQLTVSYNTAFIIPVFFILMLYAIAERRGSASAVACAAAFALGGFITMVPQGLYQYWAFGSPLRSGYFAWVHQPMPLGMPAANAFTFPFPHLEHDMLVLELLARAGFDACVSNPIAMLLDLTGLGELYNLAVFSLLAAGYAFLRMRKEIGARVLVLSSTLLVLVYFLGYAAYVFSHTRFFIQLLPCLLILCAEGFITGYRAVRGRWARGERLLLCVLLAFSMSGAAGAARQKYVNPPPEPCMYEIATAYGTMAGEGSVVVSGICGAYLCHFFTRDAQVTWLPVSMWVRLARYEGHVVAPVASDELGLLHAYINAGRPVFIDDFYETRFAKEYRLIEEEFKLERVRNICGHGIFRLREHTAGPGGLRPRALRGGQ